MDRIGLFSAVTSPSNDNALVSLPVVKQLMVVEPIGNVSRPQAEIFYGVGVLAKSDSGTWLRFEKIALHRKNSSKLYFYIL